MEVTTSVVVPVFPTLHTKSNSSWQWIGAGVQASGISGSVVGSQGLMSEDAVLESTTSEVGVIFKRHVDG